MKIVTWVRNVSRELERYLINSDKIYHIHDVIIMISRQFTVQCFLVFKVFEHMNQHRWHGRF